MARIDDGRFEHLTVLPFEIEKTAKDAAPSGRPRLTIRGWASTEEEDLDREVIHVGAFDAHLPDFMRNPQLVWQHQWGDSQGLWREVRPEVGRGYWIEGEMIHFGTPEDDRRFAMVEERVVRSMSVGFNGRYTADYGHWDETDPDGYPTRSSVWHWTQNCRLLEVSLCTIPANPGASIALAKAAGLRVVMPGQMNAHSATPFSDLPLADDDTAWDAAAARKRLAEWAGGPDKDDVDWSRYRKAFAWYDADAAETFGAYKLPVADVIGGELRAVWRAVAAGMAALLGGRGGIDIPDADRRPVYNHLARYYREFDKEPPEFRSEAGSGPVDWKAGEKDVLEENRALEDVQRIMGATQSLANITRHWTKGGGGPSAAVTGAAVSAITAGASIVKASEVLSTSNRADLTQAAELLGGVLQRDADNRARRETEDDKAGAAAGIIRLRL